MLSSFVMIGGDGIDILYFGRLWSGQPNVVSDQVISFCYHILFIFSVKEACFVTKTLLVLTRILGIIYNSDKNMATEIFFCLFHKHLFSAKN